MAEIRFFRQTMMHALKFDLSKGSIFDAWPQVEAYLRASMVYLAAEQVRILYLDAKNRLLRDEVAASGTIDEARVYVREIIARALSLGAQGMIIVHNHPSGNAGASGPDIDVTRAIVRAAEAVRIRVHDHIIIAAGGHTSMRASGLM